MCSSDLCLIPPPLKTLSSTDFRANLSAVMDRVTDTDLEILQCRYHP